MRSIFLIVCMCCSLITLAQSNFKVSGIVIGVDKEPIIGATIQDKSNQTGVITDVEGRFTINASSRNAVLRVGYIGMKSEEIKVEGRSQITIILQEEAVKIDEVVVTALGIKREAKALGYAVSSVNNDALTAGNEQNVMSAISGKVAGVDISSTTAGPSGSTRVIIRGNSQLTGSNQPLYVIDGMPVDNTELEGAGKWGGYDYGDVLSSLNPDDIENISILKGPSASALYGSRASNGVVLITTKSAQKKKGIGVEFSSNLSIVKLLTGFDDYQRVYGQGRDGRPSMSGQSASTTSQVAWGGKLDPNMDVHIYNDEIRKYGNVNNNILSFFDTGITTTNAVAFSKTNDLSAFVGGNVMRYEYESMIQTGQTQVIPGLQDITNYSSIETEHALVRKAVRSLFGQVSLGYKEFAYLDATFRNDVSSTLSPKNRSYFYPSVSGSLIFSNLFEHKEWFTFGKLRASWAKVGGDTSPYQLQLEYGLKPYTNKGTSLGYITSGSVPNANLKPTSTYSFEVGMDVRFLDNRLGLDFTYYQQITKDQILSLPVSQSTGYSRAMINAGEISNKGIEASLSLVPVKTKNFTWDANINFAKNYNEVVKLHEDVKDFELAAARWANAFIYASEGQPYGVIVGKKLNRTEAGEVIYENGLPTFDDKVSVLGNGNYDFTLGFRNAFSYKNLSMSVLVDMKFGADVYSMSKMQSHVNGTSKETLEGREGWYASEQARLSANVDAKDWTPTGGYVGKGVKAVTDADGNVSYVPNDVYVDPAKYWQALQNSSPEPFICDNSFVKLREVSLSYSCPKKWFVHTPIESVTLSAYGRNLLLIYSKVDNIDPESSYNNGNGQGFEYGSLPSRRTFGFGINVKF